MCNEDPRKDNLEIALDALERISQIEDKLYGGDWDVIEEARKIAITAINKIKSVV